METLDYWQAYVGPESPLEFMGRYDSDEPALCVQKYLSRLPHLFGIVRRQSWTSTFAQEDQLRKGAVLGGLTAHLEATREDWEPALEDYRRSRSQRPESVLIEDEVMAEGDDVEAEAYDEDGDFDSNPDADTATSDDAAESTDTDVDTTRNVEEELDNIPPLLDAPETETELPADN